MADNLTSVSALIQEGRFETALQRLQSLHPRWQSSFDRTTRLAGLELLERTGRLPAARNLLSSFKPRSALKDEERTRLALAEGLIAKHLGHIPEAEQHFLKACQQAQKCDSLELLCWAQLRLMGVAGDSATKEQIPAIRSELRRNVERIGVPSVSVAFHIFTAEYEAKHGQLALSKFHSDVAESLLDRYPNLWLRGLLDLQKSCLSYLEGNFAVALWSAQRAWSGSAESGHAQTGLLALGDMAAVYLAVGQPSRASSCVAHAMRIANPDEQVYGLLLETLAEGQLAAGDLPGCARSLSQAESIANKLGQRRQTWYQDWNLRTKVRLLQRKGEWGQCLAVLRSARKAGSSPFSDSQLQILEAMALCKTGQPSEAARSLVETFSRPIDTSPLIQGLVQTAAGGLFATDNLSDLALRQYARALRILAGTGESSGLLDAVDQYVETIRHGAMDIDPASSQDDGVPVWRPMKVKCYLDRTTGLASGSTPGLTELAAFIGSAVDLASEPQAIGEETLRILMTLGWIDRGTVEKIAADGTRQVTASYLGAPTLASEHKDVWQSRELSISIGSKGGIQFALGVVPKQNSQAALGCGAALRMILALSSSRSRTKGVSTGITMRSSGEPEDSDKYVFQSPAMISLVEAVRRVASQDIIVLLTGESGTGKEVIANLIHEAAGPVTRPFVVFNCATIPTDMVESQLFGYRRGAFTGAVDSFLGVIRAAEGGTLFLDEIAELPAATQPKLLRFLDALEVQPLGEALPHRVKVRIVAATNADLEQRVREGRFRADLFYRLNVIHFHLPPLRERREDIRPLAESFLVKATEEIGKPGVRFDEGALEHLLLRSWPGNVRQLLHEIRRVAAFALPESMVSPKDLEPQYMSEGQPKQSANPTADGCVMTVNIDRPLAEVVNEVEMAVLERALGASNWRNDQAAERLGLSRKGLYLKRRRLGIVDSDG